MSAHSRVRTGHARGETGEKSASPATSAGDKTGDALGAANDIAHGMGKGPALAVALDLPSAHEALAMERSLAGLALWLKVGLELFTNAGPDLVRRLTGLGRPVFLDLKFHDIPNTVYGAVRSAMALKVSMLTLHTAGGEAMCRAAVRAVQDAAPGGPTGAAPDAPRGSAGRLPLLMGVTVLTSESGDAKAIRDTVVERALLARRCGLDGVVCSGFEVPFVKEACGSDFLCLCPGIRFAGEAGGDDQARVLSPQKAATLGADFLVMGRPVTRASDPAAAARKALAAASGG